MCTQAIPNSQDYDLIIVGGGATGLALALGLIPYLQKQQLGKILLLEKETSCRVIPGRSIALNHNTLNYLHSLKLPQQLCQQLGLSHASSVGELLAPLFCPIQQITTKTDSHPQAVEFYAAEFRLGAFGGVVDLAQLQAGLEAVLTQYQTYARSQGQELAIELCKGVSVTACIPNDTGTGQVIKVVTEDGVSQELCCNLAVIANGAKFISGLSANLETAQVLNFAQYGIIADVIFNRPVQNRAIEFFTQHGPVAFLPTSSQSACVVWCGTAPQITSLQDHQSFAQELNRNLLQIANATAVDADLSAQSTQAYNQGLQVLHKQPKFIQGNSEFIPVTVLTNEHLQVVGITKTASYPLPAMRLTQITQPHVVFLGNAAHTLHPVSGQGFNLATLGVQNLLRALEQAWQSQDAQTNLWQAVTRNYEQLHQPVIDQVYSRTTKLATSFIPHGDHPTWTRWQQDLALGMMRGNPWLQELMVQPSLGQYHSPWLNYLITRF